MNLRLREAVRGADLGGSSNYSDEIQSYFVRAFSFEDCESYFHVSDHQLA